MKKFKYGLSLLLTVFLFAWGNAQKSDLQKSSPLYDEITTMKSSYHPLDLQMIKSDIPTTSFKSESYVNYTEFFQFENRSQNRTDS